MRLLLSITIILASLGSSLAGQSRTIPRSCVPDRAETGTFTGVLQLRTYPGPPNYSDTVAGDKPERGIYLLLDGMACKPTPGDTVGVYTRSDLEAIQLILDADEYRRAQALLGKHVSIKGVLSPAETGHHHTLLILVPSKPLRITTLDP